MLVQDEPVICWKTWPIATHANMFITFKLRET